MGWVRGFPSGSERAPCAMGLVDPLIGWSTETLRFERLLGKGGMGSVYQGVQIQMNRKVAIKVIAPHLFEDPSYRERFTREAQTLGRLVHANIIGAHDFGPVPGPNGKDLFVMVLEFVNGWNLGTLLKEKRLTVRQVLNLHAQAAEGLAMAHSQGVIHRDIKPDNLMVTRKGVCKLADFGLARAADSIQVTITGAIIGSPAYMSPEACRGVPPTTASDVYSLGCSLFQSLTDNVPYPGIQSLAVLQAHISQPVPSLLPHRPDLPRLEAVIQKLLAKRPQDRPTASELVKILQAEAGVVDENLVAGRIRANSQPGRLMAAQTELTRGVQLRPAPKSWPWLLGGVTLGGVILAGSLYLVRHWPALTPSVSVTPQTPPPAETPEPKVKPPAPLNPVLEKPVSPPALNPVRNLLDQAETKLNGSNEPVRRLIEAQILLDMIPSVSNGTLATEDNVRLADLRRRIESTKKSMELRKPQLLERLRNLERPMPKSQDPERSRETPSGPGH